MTALVPVRQSAPQFTSSRHDIAQIIPLMAAYYHRVGPSAALAARVHPVSHGSMNNPLFASFACHRLGSDSEARLRWHMAKAARDLNQRDTLKGRLACAERDNCPVAIGVVVMR